MSFVLSVVCVDPYAEPSLPDGPLFIQEVVQDARADQRACYIPGLSKFFDSPIRGCGYYVWIKGDDQYPSARAFFRSPAATQGDEQPIIVHIDPEYRAAFDTLLRALLSVSRVQRVLIVAEWNGDVTAAGVSREQALAELAAGEVFFYGPWSVEDFWARHDDWLVYYPSVTVVQDDTER
jgi:hypothetical protein